MTFAGSPGAGFGIGSIYFVDSNGATGGGNGSGSDGANPATLSAVETLATGATDIIVLVNNGAAISAAGSNGNDTLALNSGVQVRGFGNGVGGGAGTGSAPIALTLTVPSTILLSGGTTLNIADPTGMGAATLTSAAGANVISLGAANNRISGFILDGSPAGALRGINDNGGATNTLIDRMTIRNFNAVGGYGIEVTPSTNTTIDNVLFSGNAGDVLVNAAGTTISNVSSTGATGTSLTIANATGTTTLTNINIVGAATGIAFTNAGGTINGSNVDIGGATSQSLLISGGTANFNFDAASSITQSAGAAAISITGNHTTGTFGYAGTINATGGTGLQFNDADGIYNFTGTTTLNGGDAGIDIVNGSSGTFAFGTSTAITNPSGDAFGVLNSNANITYSGSITDNTGYAVSIDNHDAGAIVFQTGTISNVGAAAQGIVVQNSNGGSVAFNGQTQLDTGANTAVSLANNGGSTIGFNAAGSGLDITTTSGTGFAITGAGTVNVLGGNNSIVTGSGTLLNVTNASASALALDLAFASATNTSGASGILIDRASTGGLTGSVTIAGGAITATTRGVDLNGEALDFTYGGTIATTGGSARSVEVTGHTAGTTTFSGDITDNGLGINVSNNTGGTIAFTGQNIALTTQNNQAVTLANNSGATINFAPLAGGNGFDIATTGGLGFGATGGGTINVTGTGNSIQTDMGMVANFDSVLAGASGITFAQLGKSSTSGGQAYRFNNLDGTSFTVTGNTSVNGSGGGDNSLFIGGNSAATFNFASYTSNNSSSAAIAVSGAGNGPVTFGSVSIGAGTAGDGVSIANSDNSVTINGGSITGFNRAVAITGGTGNVSIAAALSKTSAGNVAAVSGHTAGTISFSGSINATGGFDNGIVIGTSGGAINFTGPTINLSTGAFTGVSVTGAAAGAAVGFTPIAGGNGFDIATTTGTGMILTGNGGATYTVSGPGGSGAANSITTTSGTLLNITNATANAMTLAMAFGSASNTSGANGILIDRSGAGAITGTLNIAGGAITATTRGVDLNGESLNFTYGGAITAASGRSIEVTGHSAGTVTFSGAIADTGQGINLSSNTGGTITISGSINAVGTGATAAFTAGSNTGGTINLSGTTKRFNTGASTAVDLTNNTGAAINFVNGGLAATTTSGGAFNATGGGTITASGSGNTLTSTSGRALNVVNTLIGASNLTFQSISSNGAPSGITLNSTGTSGGLSVTGTGATGSGGTIQNSVGDGISLTSTENVRLSYMNIINNLGNGIGGTGINGFLLDGMTITGNGNDAVTDESGINITGLTGSASNGARPTGILNSTISNNNEFEVQIVNASGTLTNFQLTNSTISSNGLPINGNGTSPHGNLVNFLGTGTSAMGITVSNTDFIGNWNAASPPTTITGTGLQIDTSGTSMTANISGSRFTNNNAGISVSTGPVNSALTYSIVNNVFTGQRSTAIADFQNGTAPFIRTVNGTITGNTIGTNGVAQSGSLVGNGISIGNEGAVNATYLISGNTIQQIGQAGTSGSSAIAVNVGLAGVATGGGTTNLTIQNNIIRDILNSRGIVVQNNQTVTGPYPVIRLNLSNNMFTNIAGQAGNGQILRFATNNGSIAITQAQATAAANAAEIDDANGFNDSTKVSTAVTGSGTITYNQSAPSTPPAVTPLP